MISLGFLVFSGFERSKENRDDILAQRRSPGREDVSTKQIPSPTRSVSRRSHRMQSNGKHFKISQLVSRLSPRRLSPIADTRDRTGTTYDR